MSTSINDGGPAFPRTGAESHTSPQPGMSLRDWFAGQASVGLLASPSTKITASSQELAEACYEFADAMLAARERKGGES